MEGEEEVVPNIRQDNKKLDVLCTKKDRVTLYIIIVVSMPFT